MKWTTKITRKKIINGRQYCTLSLLLFTALFFFSPSIAFSQNSIAYLKTDLSSEDHSIIVHKNEHIIPFELVRGMIVMQAKINQQPGEFILDTGAPLMVINETPKTPSRLASSFKEEVQVGETTISNFDWAGIEEEKLDALVLDISHLEQAFQRPLKGMIGFNALKEYELFFDYDNQVVLRYKARKNPLHDSAKPLHKLPFQKIDHLPVITVKIGNKKFHFGLDTGACTNMIDQSVLEAIDAAYVSELPDEEVQGLDQSITRVKAVSIHEVKTKDLQIKDLKFLATDMPKLHSEDGIVLDGLLGYSFLSRMKFSINYPKQRIYVWESRTEVSNKE